MTGQVKGEGIVAWYFFDSRSWDSECSPLGSARPSQWDFLGESWYDQEQMGKQDWPQWW